MIMHADFGGIIFLMSILTAGMTFGAYMQDKLSRKSAKK